MMRSMNPATGRIFNETESHDDSEVERRLARTHDCQKAWRRSSVGERNALLERIAVGLRNRKENLASLITTEMGKPIEEARAEVEKCAYTCDYYANNTEKMLADEAVVSPARDSRVVFDALGVLFAVMPWNYPLWQVIRAVAPAIAVGNSVVLKHAANVTLCALALEKVFVDADAPDGLFSILLIESNRVAAVIRDDRIAAVTFTGSTPVGRLIAQEAGQALKKHVLELGGSDPFIVLADANLRNAARAAAKARFSNTGQSCISAKRFIVEEKIANEFSELFVQEAAIWQFGDPLNPASRLGPMARANLRDELHHQVLASAKEGATVLSGGEVPVGSGFFYPATVLDHVEPGMTAASQETFGPAAAIIRVRDAEAAVEIANSTEFGLGGAIWTTDVERGRSLARHIDAGAIFINSIVASDPRLPFGGIKQSGYGRELGVWGLREFANVKTVYTA